MLEIHWLLDFGCCPIYGFVLSMKIWDCFVTNVVVLQTTCKFPPGNERFGPWLRVESLSSHRKEEKNSMTLFKKPAENFTLIPSPNLLAWPKVDDNVENTTTTMYGLNCSFFFFPKSHL